MFNEIIDNARDIVLLGGVLSIGFVVITNFLA